MSQTGAAQNEVQSRLSEAISSQRLPEAKIATAQKLLSRLEKPTRVSILGLPKSGKSTVLNLLSGAGFELEDLRLPTMRLSYSDSPSASVTLPDGSVTEHQGVELGRISRMKPVFIELRMPIAALKKITLLEIVPPNDRVEQIRALKWAMKHTDIALWCTSDFSGAEQALWQDVPDHIKDHAILLVTKSDEMGDRVEAKLGTVRRIGGDQFAHVIAISAKGGLSAQKDDGTIDRSQMRNSGSTALISTVLRQIESGRQYTVDQAEILLHAHAQEAVKPENSVDDHVEEFAPESLVVETDASSSTVDLTDIFQAGVERLTQVGRSLSQAEEIVPATAINKSLETVQWLSDHLSENGPQDSVKLALLRDTAIDAADLVQLYQLEDSDDVATDAIALLVQLKHQLQAELAA